MKKYYYILASVIALIITVVFLLSDKTVSQDKSDKKIFTVILDAGHGGKDPGTTGTTGVYERNIVLPITQKIRDYLSKEYTDIKVVMTRDSDDFIELKTRGSIANTEGGNLFVSIHCNAKKNEENDKSGFEIYVLDLARVDEAKDITYDENVFIAKAEKPDSAYIEQRKILASIYLQTYLRYSNRFANIIETEMIKGCKLPSRGVFQAGFWVLLSASMPSVLVECGYLSNKSDEEYLKSEKGQTEIAKSVFKAIRYFKMDYDFENTLMN
ncbi:MAG: N-acetylmuramoyl-L-alanine amidase [Candidatus Kapaibacterium sp.]